MNSFYLERVILISILGFMGGCTRSSPEMQPPPEKIGVVSDTVEIEESFDPKVDVLFVIDNSQSMDSKATVAHVNGNGDSRVSLNMAQHLKKLKTNAKLFVDAFSSNTAIDVHIGVVSVFDSKRFLAPNAPHYYPLGQLRRPGDPDRIDPITEKELPLFISRDNLDLLASTIGLNAHSLETGGPEFEESFSPVSSVLNSHPQSANYLGNQGFLRADADLLVLIFVTDAQDESDIAPQDLVNSVVQYMGASRVQQGAVMAFGVLSLEFKDSAGETQQCPRDVSGLEPTKITSFLREMNKTWAGYDESLYLMSLCSNDYGSKLAGFGSMIKKRIKNHFIGFTQRPEIGTLRVTYGKNQGDIEWSYDPDKNGIVIPGQAQVSELEGEAKDRRIKIQYRPAQLGNTINGRTQRVGGQSNQQAQQGQGLR